jgi:hypothetical protein
LRHAFARLEGRWQYFVCLRETLYMKKISTVSKKAAKKLEKVFRFFFKRASQAKLGLVLISSILCTYGVSECHICNRKCRDEHIFQVLVYKLLIFYKPFYVIDLRVVNVICSFSSSQNSGSKRPIFTYLGPLERPLTCRWFLALNKNYGLKKLQKT